MDGYQALANAIVEQAVTDYRRARRKLTKDPKHETAQVTVKGIERFIRSSWYSMLTNVDPDALMDRLKKENT